jgi:hypothetical protein
LQIAQGIATARLKAGLVTVFATALIRAGALILRATKMTAVTVLSQLRLNQYAETEFAMAMRRTRHVQGTAAHIVAMEFVTEKIHLRHALKTAA